MSKLKKIAAGFLIGASINAYAQEGTDAAEDKPAKRKNMASIEVGVSASKDISFDGEYNDGRRLYAPSVGVGYYIHLDHVHWITTGLGYHQIGDVYHYYTGINSETTDVRIYVHTIKVPLLYTAIFDKGNKANFFIKVGPSLDIALGESVIKPKAALNSPSGFRDNVTQGSVRKNKFALLNLAAGINFKSGAIEFLYYGTVNDIYRASPYGAGKSRYNNLALKLCLFF